ncbi:hypothetical protein OHA18_41430 [Kribbella sp. NBC_00709]|uniref:hypothetical protein n=1 Tax=Kribbella sp. NBC_00709 TaxID=2975972 RepID=UPI002E2C4341|nr:hypothetical protein [Kribbella sp. NBC_00709]
MILTGAYSVAREDGCQGFRVFLASLFLRQGEPTNCLSVPFLVDIPTVLLSLTAPFAAISYLVIIRRLETLIQDLQRTGLAPKDSASTAGRRSIAEALDRYIPRGWQSALIFAISVMMTIWLYSRNLESGGIFQALANPAAPEATLRDRWWANYHHHVILAIYCVGVGAIGVHFTLTSAWLYGLVGRYFVSARNEPRFHARYVPRWRDRSFGWAPAIGLIMLSYATTINFAISMIAVFDMLQTGSLNRTVAGVFAVIGVITDLTFVIMTLRAVIQSHKRVRAEVQQFVTERISHAELRRRQSSRSSKGQAPRGGIAGSDVDVVLAARDAENWPLLPISNPAVGLLKIAPGLYAIFQLIRTLGGS